MLILHISISTFAYDWSTNPGDGSEGNPYQISEPDHLMAIGSDPNLLEKHFILANDIVFDPNNNPEHVFDDALIAPDIDSSEGFQGTEFTGAFNGDGHVIENMRIEGNSNDYLGLFGSIGNSGEVRNIGLENALIFGNSYIGGFVALNKGLIEECYSKSYITSNSNYAGVFAGENWGSIRFAYAEGSVLGIDYVGGFSGANSTGVIDGCYSTSQVTGNNFKGGFVGYSEEFYTYPLYGCFFDRQNAGIDTDGIATGLGTNYLQDLYTYGKWICDESNEKWTIHNKDDYPRLSWEQKTGISISRESIWHGQGTKEDPYLIYNAGAFYAMGGFVDCILDKHFKLMNDIDLSLYDGQEGRPSISPIAGFFFLGENPITCDFLGSFNGDFHAIKNVRIDPNAISSNSLFGAIGENGLIENLYIENIFLKGSGASLAEYVYSGAVVRNCNANVNLSYFDKGWTGGQIGGLVGDNRGLIKDCSVTGSISIDGMSSESASGIACHNNQGSIIQCYTDVNLTGNGTLAGLVVVNGGTISQCYASGSVNEYNSAGALIVESYGDGTITESYFLDSSGPDNGYGTLLDDPNMMIQSNFTNWDFLGESTNGSNDIWRMCIDGVDYPRLSMEFAQNGDFACEDGVDIYDLQALAEHWLITEITDPTTFSYACDANGDGVIDLLDYSVLGENW